MKLITPSSIKAITQKATPHLQKAELITALAAREQTRLAALKASQDALISAALEDFQDSAAKDIEAFGVPTGSVSESHPVVGGTRQYDRVDCVYRSYGCPASQLTRQKYMKYRKLKDAEDRVNRVPTPAELRKSIRDKLAAGGESAQRVDRLLKNPAAVAVLDTLLEKLRTHDTP